MTGVGVLGRLVFWAGLAAIIVHAIAHFLDTGDTAMAVAGAIFFPITYLIYPWFSGLWWLLLISLGGYWLSTLVGGMEPVD